MLYTGYLDFWFLDAPPAERVARFAELGIRAVDIWMWRAKGESVMAELAAACREAGSAINSTFDEAAGSLTDASDHPACLDAWTETLELAQRWGAQHLFMFSEQIDPLPARPGHGRTGETGLSHIQGWVKQPSRNYSPEQRYANLIDGAAKVMERVEKTGIVVWFEALNTYHLHGPITVHTHEQAADVVRRIRHPQLRMSFDCYHQQRTAGNLIQGLRDCAGLYDSVHIGDVPTRQEPGTGEINFANLARALRDLGYDTDGRGKIGLEFFPSADERDALARVKAIFEP